MAFLSFLPILGPLIDKLVPDVNAAAQAKLELAKMEATGELQQVMAQLDINKVEAASTNLFVAGWRPFIGWVCGSALASNYILAPFVAALFGRALPQLSLTDLMPVLFALLGLGGMRSFEKVKGVA